MSSAPITTADSGKAEDKSLRELFCSHYRCPPEKFEEQFFWYCLHSPRLSKLIWRLDRDFFRADIEMIRQLALVTNFSDCRHEIESSRQENPPAGLLRKTLKVRVSGQEIIKIASKLFLQQNLPSRRMAPARTVPDSTV